MEFPTIFVITFLSGMSLPRKINGNSTSHLYFTERSHSSKKTPPKSPHLLGLRRWVKHQGVLSCFSFQFLDHNCKFFAWPGTPFVAVSYQINPLHKYQHLLTDRKLSWVITKQLPIRFYHDFFDFHSILSIIIPYCRW